MTTPYHAAYYAHELTRRSASDSIEKLGSSLFNATVDLNPHQLDAALFAFRSPLSRGVILADEVGLGKTIEAGLVISQLWAERKRRVLIIAPAILRKQWSQELLEKFHIESQVIDTKEFNAAVKAGEAPLEPRDRVLIASYHFAAARRVEITATPWNLVVIDESHRLRNVYKPGNKIANAIKQGVKGRPLLLLTATPLQNDLLELYGLVSIIDEHVFGDIDTFKARYKKGAVEDRQLDDLRDRLKPICKRTLRRQVTEFIRFTNRHPITEDFTPTDAERQLYEQVSDYLGRESLNALPSGQRKLMTLVLRKLLASSTFAIAGTLESIAARLDSKHEAILKAVDTLDDFETVGELAEEWTEGGDDDLADPDARAKRTQSANLRSEIDELWRYSKLAASITVNAKGEALLLALWKGFAKMAELGAARKAVIFTESRRTQAYLIDLLNGNGYEGKVLTINGVNGDDRSGAIYKDWIKRHAGEPVVTGNKTVDLRAALVEHFRDRAEILIATEAAAEGVNLQFCSLVVNYDLPWNPQRIEQRIGRCHRYGQKHDVVVINFINRGNAADQRVFELLSEKFRLFDGVFGSSDEVLGALESGVDFERRIAEIYQTCRSDEVIDRAFRELRAELEQQIVARMADTRTKLLDHFDEEVHHKLRVDLEAESRGVLDRLERWLWEVTRHELDGVARFDSAEFAFDLDRSPAGCSPVSAGRYQLQKPRARPIDPAAPPGTDVIAFRLDHPLAEFAVARAKGRVLPPVTVRFDYSAHPGTVGILRDLVGRSGWLTLARVTVAALEDEERLVFAAVDRDGAPIDPEAAAKLFLVAGAMVQPGPMTISDEVRAALDAHLEHRQGVILAEIGARNNRYFEEQIDKLDRWADDLKNGLELEIKDLNAQIKQADREAKLAPDLRSKLDLQRTKKDLEAVRMRRQKALFDAQDEVEGRKDALIAEVEARLRQDVHATHLFTIGWDVV